LTTCSEKGTLYLVSTPIGNLKDISPRAVETLDRVDLIAAEDTRHTGLLLKHLGIKKCLESYHDHNKTKKSPGILKHLMCGESVAVVTDAGTPGISDPAYYLVKKAIETSIRIVPIPGPNAAITALVASGLPTDRFVFEGFLPVKKGRKKRLLSLSNEQRTIILYEAPHRLLRTLSDLLNYLGDRKIAVCRELTKKFEQIHRGSISEIIEEFSNKKIRGEIVLIVQGTVKNKRKSNDS